MAQDRHFKVWMVGAEITRVYMGRVEIQHCKVGVTESGKAGVQEGSVLICIKCRIGVAGWGRMAGSQGLVSQGVTMARVEVGQHGSFVSASRRARAQGRDSRCPVSGPRQQ